MLNIGIIGVGSMGLIHSALIKKNKNYNFLAACDRNTRQLDIIKNENKNLRCYQDYKELLKDQEIDFILIATTNEHHESLTIEALESGKNVIVEKPMSLNYESALRMIEAAEKFKKYLIVHHSRRWDKDFLIVKKYISSGILGKILSIQTRVMLCDEGWPAWSSEGMINPWRIKAGGGGMLLDWGAHLIDQVLNIMGKNPKHVYGFIQKGVWSKEVEDYFYASLKFESELICQIEAGNNSLIPLPRWYLIGEKGTLLVKGSNIPVWDEVEIKQKNEFGIYETKNIKLHGIKEISEGFYNDLIIYLEDKNKNFISMYEAAEVLKVIDAIRQSSDSNTIINF